MKKNLNVQTAIFPMPVLMIATYDENKNVDVMNAAWGGICDYTMLAINIDEEHKTTANMYLNKAFTVSIATVDTVKESDYFGIVSANDDKNKFLNSGFHAIESKNVNAPIIEEYPLTIECVVKEFQNQPYGLRILGEIKNVIADENILDDEGNIDVLKLNPIMFDTFKSGYYSVGKKVGNAFLDGLKVVKTK